MKKNMEIEFLRLFFSIGIVFYHFRFFAEKGDYVFFKSGYIAVDFFFIVTGLFMMKSIQRAIDNRTIENNQTTLGSESIGFVFGRIKGFYVWYLLSLIIAFVVHNGYNPRFEGTSILINVKTLVFEALLLRESGLGERELYYNGVTWYLSVMIISFMILYPFIRKFKDTATKIVLPVLVILVSGYMYKTLPVLQTSKWLGMLNWTLLRGIVDISLGCIIYTLVQKTQNLKFTRPARIIVTCLTVVIWGYVLISIFEGYKNAYDYVMILIMCIGIFISATGLSYTHVVFSKLSVLNKFRNLSLLLYLHHKSAYWILYFNDTDNLSYYKALVIYFAITLGLSVITVIISQLMKFAGKKIKSLLVL